MGCGERAPQRALVRFAAPDGRLAADPERRLPGRGAYVHRDPACLERALQRRAFPRALRRSLTVPDDLDWNP